MAAGKKSMPFLKKQAKDEIENIKTKNYQKILGFFVVLSKI
jgi:hypothetical protein